MIKFLKINNIIKFKQMKNLFIYMTAAMIAVGAAGCRKDEKQMTLTTEMKGEVKLYMRGSDSFTIDWDDGSKIETHTLNTDTIFFYHSYSDAVSRNIIITGENITDFGFLGLFTSFDVSKNDVLEILFCGYNQITSFDVRKNKALRVLNCSHNQLTGLDVRKNKALQKLDCCYTGLTSIDVRKNNALLELLCAANQLTGLDVRKNKALVYINCIGNQLTSLDVRKNTELFKLFCDSNELTGLDVRKNTALKELSCDFNELPDYALNDLFKTLPCNDERHKLLFIRDNPGTATCDRSIAEKKGWTVYY